MKKYFALLLAVVMAFSMAACAAPAEEPAGEVAEEVVEKPAAAGSVYWLNFKPESDAALQELAAMYTEETGVPVTVVTAASGTYNETLTAEMDKSDAPTMFVVGNAAAVDTWGEYCYDLTGTPIAEELNTDAYMLYDDEGKLCSIGYCYECYGIITNKALLEKAGYTIEDITNFESLKTVAEDIHARADELGFDAFTSAGMDGSSSWRFTGHLINLEYYYESVDAPEAWTECPASITGAYMDNYKNLWDLMINNSAVNPADLANGGFDANAEFANGEAVFYSQGNWEWASLQEKGMNAEELTMIPYYCGVEGEEMAGLNCGTENYWAVNSEASEEDIQATLDFMYWLVTDAEASRIAVDSFGVMPYTNAATSTNPFLAIANEYAANGRYSMWWATNYQPNVDAYRATVVSALNQYDADQTDANWEQVVTAFVDGWAAQYAAVNG
ncbi:MAG: ABC transporter substrate-binding protein [Clostridia bacterium]|nr:ABC transporter substrate-binding protein [Clostridia bacterium]